MNGALASKQDLCSGSRLGRDPHGVAGVGAGRGQGKGQGGGSKDIFPLLLCVL